MAAVSAGFKHLMLHGPVSDLVPPYVQHRELSKLLSRSVVDTNGLAEKPRKTKLAGHPSWLAACLVLRSMFALQG
jgi:hypothetical protein